MHARWCDMTQIPPTYITETWNVSNNEYMLVEVMGLGFERIAYMFNLVMAMRSSISPLLVLTTKMLTHMCQSS